MERKEMLKVAEEILKMNLVEVSEEPQGYFDEDSGQYNEQMSVSVECFRDDEGDITGYYITAQNCEIQMYALELK